MQLHSAFMKLHAILSKLTNNINVFLSHCKAGVFLTNPQLQSLRVSSGYTCFTGLLYFLLSLLLLYHIVFCRVALTGISVPSLCCIHIVSRPVHLLDVPWFVSLFVVIVSSLSSLLRTSFPSHARTAPYLFPPQLWLHFGSIAQLGVLHLDSFLLYFYLMFFSYCIPHICYCIPYLSTCTDATIIVLIVFSYLHTTE